MTWIAAVLLHDLAYYLFHRASHRVNVLWAAHAVHHQSEDYTFAVSLRQGAIATWVSYLFYLPLALLDIPVELFVIVHGVYQVYQFAVHTRFIPALGPLERVLATPLLHRVHHGRDADFLDKNYGGFFIFWDKLFGSFAPYTREPDYGVTAGITSWSPFWANLHPYAELARRARRAPDRRAALEVWLRPPEWRAPWDATTVVHARLRRAAAARTAIYSLVQLAAAVAARWCCCGRASCSPASSGSRCSSSCCRRSPRAPRTGIGARGRGAPRRSGSAWSPAARAPSSWPGSRRSTSSRSSSRSAPSRRGALPIPASTGSPSPAAGRTRLPSAKGLSPSSARPADYPLTIR